MEHSRGLDKKMAMFSAQKMSKMQTWPIYVLRKRAKQSNTLEKRKKKKQNPAFCFDELGI